MVPEEEDQNIANLIISILLTDFSKHKNTAMQYVQAENCK